MSQPDSLSAPPVLRLAETTQLRPTGLWRDDVHIHISDGLLVAALSTGLDPARLSALHESDQRWQLLDALHRAGMLTWSLDGVAHAEVLARGIGLDVPEAKPGPIELSRFAVLHREGQSWVLESALSLWRLRLSAHGVRLLADGDPHGWLHGLLAVTGMLDGADEQATGWTLHDRLFLSRTRGHLPFLMTAARHRGVAPEPGLRESGQAAVPLPRPRGPEPAEPTLFEATEARRTRRDFTDRPVSLRALGHLLWRTLRVCDLRPADPEDPLSYDVILRPVPSGGAMHATDLWLFCSRVQDLAPGAYRYDPLEHALVHVAGIGGDLPAPVVGLITARHKRTAWKYDPIALSLELKDVGVQMMALQLSAAVVGLGVCPIGSGSTAEVAMSLGIDPMVDAPIGEFFLGCVEPVS